MCNLSQGIADEAWAEGFAEGYAKGRAQYAKFKALTKPYLNLTCKQNFSPETALDILDIPPEEQEDFFKLLNNADIN